MKATIRTLALLSAIFVSAPAWAQDAPAAPTDADVSDEISEDEVVEKSYRETKDWSLGVALGSSIGQGTFASVSGDTEYEGELADASNAFDRWNMSWSVNGSYTFLDDFSASVEMAGVQWFTDGGGLNDSGEHRFQDIGAYVSWGGYTFEAIDLTLSSDATFIFPTSDLSRYYNLIVSTGLGVGVAWRGIPSLTLTYNLSGGKDFHSFTSPTVSEQVVGAENVIFRAGGSEDVGQGEYAIDGVNTEWSLANSFGASLAIWEALRVSISYSLTTFWSYSQAQDDEFTPENADPGRGVGQLQRGNLTVSYGFTEFANSIGLSSLSVNAGLRTATTPLTDDQQSLNFPFWGTNGAAGNASSIRFGLSASY